MRETLSIRRTFTYVGAYKHLDKWDDIGTLEVIGTRTETQEDAHANEEAWDDYDVCEPMLQEHIVRVALDELHPFNRVETALYNAFDSHGCGHDFDCCGCRSYHTSKVEHLRYDLWRVLVHSSRNF